jgi:YtoQ family protein
MSWNVYLSGEIHTDWRERIQDGANRASLDITFATPVTHHESSDDVGDAILGKEDKVFWRDHKAAKINAIRIQKAIEDADLVVVRFGEKFKQWNAAFDAGYAAALGVPIVTLHDEGLTHPLKEVDAAARATAQTPEQIVEILQYLLTQK